MALCLLAILFGTSGQNILESGLYNVAQESKSSLNEYFILFYCFLYLSRPKNIKKYNLILFSIFSFYVIKNLLYGGRIEILQLCLLMLLLKYTNYIKKKYLISLILIGTYLSLVFSFIRNNILDFLTGDNVFKYFNPINFLNTGSSVNINYLASNQGDVIHSSSRILGLIEEGFLGTVERLFSFGYYLTSSFIGFIIKLPDYWNVAIFKQEIYQSGGGALISTYFYTWMGVVGPALAGLFIGFVIKQGYITNSNYVKIYLILILCSYPRWIAYSPIHLFKFCIYGVIIYFIFELITKTIIKIQKFNQI